MRDAKQDSEKELTKAWRRYRAGVDHHNALSMYSQDERCHKFYVGRQWEGAKLGEEDLPVYNILKPIGKYKISMIAQNRMAIVFLPSDDDPQKVAASEALTKFAGIQWEKSKMDSLSWAVIKNAFITGDHYLYCFAEEAKRESLASDSAPALHMRSINRSALYLADEQNPDLHAQEWIILAERLPVAKLREQAAQNGLSEEQIALITADEDTQGQIGEDAGREVKTALGKCVSLLMLRKTPEGVYFSRSVKSVVYVPEQLIAGLDMYPLVGMRWEEEIGSARGVSGVWQLLPNQLIINKTAARRAISIKRFAFPVAVYDAQRIRDVEGLDRIGARIAVDNLEDKPVTAYLQYLSPQPISADASGLQMELINQTRDLEGAGDAATGQVDPTKASGEAIKAARDQAAVPLNEQIAFYKQFVEDLATLWLRMWSVYSAQGLQISLREEGQVQQSFISGEMLRELELETKIEVSPIDPYSNVSLQIVLDRLLERQHISFEEYVGLLDESAMVPKAKLHAVLAERAAQTQQEAQMQQQQQALAAMQQMGPFDPMAAAPPEMAAMPPPDPMAPPLIR